MSSLESKLGNGVVDRRSFLGLLGLAGVGVACGGGGSSGPTPVPSSVPSRVSRNFVVLNSDGTQYGTFSDVFDGGSFSISADYLASKVGALSGGDARYFVVSDAPVGGFWGRPNGQARNGVATGRFSGDGTSYVAVLNSKNGADYPGAFATPGFGNGILAQNATLRFMLPGEEPSPGYVNLDGRDDHFITAVNWINDSAVIGGVQLASIGYIGKTSSPATMRCGYHPSSLGSNGHHGSDWAMLNKTIENRSGAERYAFIEVFEVLGKFDDLYGFNSSTNVFFDNNDNLKNSAVDLVKAGTLFGIR